MTESIKREFIENAAEIGIDLNDKMLSSFDIYYKNLLEWNAVMNLTAITEEKDVFEKHFLDSLTITKIVSRETLDKGCTLLSGTSHCYSISQRQSSACGFPEQENQIS